jgi:hypothetical protein
MVSKSETRNPKEIGNPKSEKSVRRCCSAFGFLAAFEDSTFGFCVGQTSLLAGADHSSLKAAAIGSLAARKAGSSPPINPMAVAQMIPRISSSRVTLKAKVT